MNEILLTMSRQQYAKCFINTMKYMYRIYTSVNITAIQKQSGLKTESTKGRCLHSRLDWSTCTQSVQASMLIHNITPPPTKVNTLRNKSVYIIITIIFHL